MPKNIPQPTVSPARQARQEHDHKEDHSPEPLSGSKKVKNRNHSRQNHGEGS